MPTITVRNVPDELLERLKRRAKANHRSLQGELMAILETEAARERFTVDELYRRAKARGLHTPSESVGIIREDRDSR